MGLEKTITNNQGIDTSYWNIDQLLIKHKDKQVSIILAGFADKTAPTGARTCDPAKQAGHQIPQALPPKFLVGIVP